MYASFSVRALHFIGLLLFLFVFSIPCFAQSLNLTGKVTDPTGNPLAGATITIKNTGKATTTNDQGVFLFTAAPNSGTLVISYVGYATVETKFTSGGEMRISLKE